MVWFIIIHLYVSYKYIPKFRHVASIKPSHISPPAMLVDTWQTIKSRYPKKYILGCIQILKILKRDKTSYYLWSMCTHRIVQSILW